MINPLINKFFFKIQASLPHPWAAGASGPVPTCTARVSRPVSKAFRNPGPVNSVNVN